jgi:hypothetical protein
MRYLAPRLFRSFRDGIIETAKAFQEYGPADDSATNPYRKIATDKLAAFRQESQRHQFRLQKVDMLVVADTMTETLAPYDTQIRNGVLNTDNGNASIILQTGVVVAAILGNQRMVQVLEYHSPAIAEYLRAVYDFCAVDPGDPRIAELSQAFVTDRPEDAEEVMLLLDRLTKAFVAEIHLIPEKENYLARHMFLTGLVEYPGIGCEVEIIRAAQAAPHLAALGRG